MEEEQFESYRTPRFQIPYDCRFIIIQPFQEKYKLTEVYTVEKNTFYLDYRMWNSKHGLQVDDTFFLAKRQNLNKTEILLLAMDVR